MSGPHLVWASGGFVALLTAALLSTPSPGEEELRAVLRVTALTSSLLFLPAFAASALMRLRPSDATRWLLRHRRYVGLSFAVSHAIHTGAIVALQLRNGFLDRTPPATLYFGGLGLLVVGVMAATSNDAAARMLGRWWQRIHSVGVYYLWFIFVFTYFGPALSGSPFHLLMTGAFGATFALRLAARRA